MPHLRKCPPQCPPKCPPKCPAKCMRKGPVTNNGFLNFMRDYRSTVCGLSPTETMIGGELEWRLLPCCKKEEYRTMLCKKPCPCRCARMCPRPCPRRQSPVRKRSCSRPRSTRPRYPSSPRSTYVNFLRCFLKEHREMTIDETIKKAAGVWCQKSQIQ